MVFRAALLLIAILLLLASPARAGTSVGGGTSMTVVHFLKLVLRRMGFTEREADSCRPTEQKIERHRAARAGRLPGVGRHESSSDPCAAALDHALELEGDAVKGSIGARASAPKYAQGAKEEAPEPAASGPGVRSAN